MNLFYQIPSSWSNSLKRKWVHLISIILLATFLLSAISCAGISKTNIATVQGISASSCFFRDQGTWGSWGSCLNVSLKPSSALENNTYTVDLYEKGKFRASTTVSWNQPEINVHEVKQASFPISDAEYSAYYMKNISSIFSVKVHE